MPWQETDVLGLMCYPCPRFVPSSSAGNPAGFILDLSGEFEPNTGC